MRNNYPLQIRVVGRTWQHLLLILALCFSGCASARFDLSKTKAVPQGEGAVFGRVKVISGGKIMNLSSVLGESRFSVVILPDTSSEGMSIPLKKEGYFFWHLPSGGYTIAGFEWGPPANLLTGRVFADFDVTGDKVTYIGTLTIVFDGRRYAKFVEDEYDPALQEFRKRFPEIGEDITKRLMVMEKTR